MRVCACLQPCVQVCAYMCASVCLQAVCGAEQSRERKTDRSVTAHFPAHYRQQGLMGAYNEGPCLGLVKGEHSPNSRHPSSAPFRLPNLPSSCYTLLYIPGGLWSCPSLCFSSPLPPIHLCFLTCFPPPPFLSSIPSLSPLLNQLHSPHLTRLPPLYPPLPPSGY